ncbi:MAG TPA: hypothetical protein VFF10_10305 [Trueperaceae bacterium]|nr:hypothetical protein [Trueperaceae bacterium]
MAASWLVMGLEMPVVSAVMARLADPEVNLAAYGGVVMPIALLIEAPIMMLLTASTALAKDMASYRLMYRFMMAAGLSLTVLHAALAFTPLYEILVVPLLGPPEVVREPAQLGLALMLPWTWAIAYRRYHQGLLIRFDLSRHVSIGTVVRLIVLVLTLLVSALLGASGIVAGGLAIAMAVTAEAVYSGIVTRPIVTGPLARATPVDPPLRFNVFWAFYAPLALTSFVSLVVQPLGSAAIARMPEALPSLAAWPVVGGLLFMFRSLGFAFNEVVVAMLDRPGAFHGLKRFTATLGGAVLAATLLVAFTPLSTLWFSIVSGLEPELARLATYGFAAALLWPFLDVLRNLFQGVIVHAGRTTSISESMFVFLGVAAALLLLGTTWRAFPALPYAMVSFVVATAAQVTWLWWRSRPALRKLSTNRGEAPAAE